MPDQTTPRLIYAVILCAPDDSDYLTLAHVADQHTARLLADVLARETTEHCSVVVRSIVAGDAVYKVAGGIIVE